MSNQYTDSARRRIVLDAIKRDPNGNAQTIARGLLARNPDKFVSLNAARCAVRWALGVSGKESRKTAAMPRPKRNAGDDWEQYLPAPMTTVIGGWAPLEIKGAHRALILSDIHIPFHDQSALKLAIEYGRSRDASLVVLNGDVMDCYNVPSRWVRDPSLREFPDEIRAGKQFTRAIRAAFPGARIIWKWGNHEERYDKALRAQPWLYGMDALKWENVFDYKEHGIEHVADMRPIVLGKLNIVHGHEFGSGFIGPVNPARTFFLKAGGVHVLGGHYHQTSQHSSNNLEQNVVSAWSTGALCEPHPAYRPINNHNAGFAFVEIDAKGAFQVENKRIVDGRAW